MLMSALIWVRMFREREKGRGLERVQDSHHPRVLGAEAKLEVEVEVLLYALSEE